ncbi:hypothetical protein ALC56_09223, partial [Trachymyrmex septentrionalis]
QDEQLFVAHSIDSCPSHFLDVAISCVVFAFPFPDAVATAPFVAARNFSNRTSDVSSQARIMFSQPIGQNREPSVATPFDPSAIAAAGAPFTAETGMYIYIYYMYASRCVHAPNSRSRLPRKRELTTVEAVESYSRACPNAPNGPNQPQLPQLPQPRRPLLAPLTVPTFLSLSVSHRPHHTHGCECIYT